MKALDVNNLKLPCGVFLHVAVITVAETVHDAGGGSVVDDVGAIVEVVQVVTTIEAPKTKHMI